MVSLFAICITGCRKTERDTLFLNCLPVEKEVTAYSNTKPDMDLAYQILMVFRPLDTLTKKAIDSLYNPFPGDMPIPNTDMDTVIQKVVNPIRARKWQNVRVVPDSLELDTFSFDIGFVEQIYPYLRACCIQIEQGFRNSNASDCLPIVITTLELLSCISEMETGFTAIHYSLIIQGVISASIKHRINKWENSEMLNAFRLGFENNRHSPQRAFTAIIRDYEEEENKLKPFIKDLSFVDIVKMKSERGRDDFYIYSKIMMSSYSRLLNSIELPIEQSRLNYDLCELDSYSEHKQNLKSLYSKQNIFNILELEDLYEEFNKLQKYSLEYYNVIRRLIFFEVCLAVREYMIVSKQAPDNLNNVEDALDIALPRDTLFGTDITFDTNTNTLKMEAFESIGDSYNHTF